MQSDMHYWGTYALARAAGILPDHARTIAYAAQFVDDSTRQDSTRHPDGGLLYGIATAHRLAKAASNSWVDREEARRVWVPFHFLPGGVGETLEERLLCVKDSAIAQEMVEHHWAVAAGDDCAFRFELLGIASHVYMDTFSHYGFSGIGSEHNEVKGGSLELIDVQDKDIEDYVLAKAKAFPVKWWRSLKSQFLEDVSRALGHAGVATYPDRPYLHWRVEFEKPRPGNGTFADRDNPVTYLEGCEKLHGYLARFARMRYADSVQIPFDAIRDTIDAILRFEGRKPDRAQRWREAIRSSAIFDAQPDEADIDYNHTDWEREKQGFHNLASSDVGIETHAYRFHQAAALHRYYVLKHLLPAHGIAVY